MFANTATGGLAIEAVKSYLTAPSHYPALQVPEGGVEQLSFSLRGAKQEDFTSPEARQCDDRRFFDIKRIALRAYSIQLLLSDDANAFELFKAQHPTVTHEMFQALSRELKSYPPALKQALIVSCYLVISVHAKNCVKAIGIEPENDSELFLSQVVENDKILDSFPLTKSLSAEVRNILRLMYPRNTHFRHMLFVEGGGNMTQYFQQMSAQQLHSVLVPWRARWIADALSFGVDARNPIFIDTFLNPITYDNIEFTFGLVQRDPVHFLEARLQRYFDQVGLDKSAFNAAEVNLLARIIGMYIGKIGQLSAAEAQQIVAAYREFPPAQREQLLRAHQEFCIHPQAVAPTYVPGLMDSVYKKLDKNIKETMLFMFYIFNALYACPPQQKNKSCQALASNIDGKLDAAVAEWRRQRLLSLVMDGEGRLVLATPSSELKPTVK